MNLIVVGISVSPAGSPQSPAADSSRPHNAQGSASSSWHKRFFLRTGLPRRATKPVVLWGLGVALVLFSDSAIAFDLIAVIASVIAFRDLYFLVAAPRHATFARVLAVSILLGYAFGAIIYLAANNTLHAADFQYWSAEGLFFDQESLAIALASSFFSAGLLYIVASYQTPVGEQVLARSSGIFRQRLVWLGVIITIVALARGDLGYMGAATSELGSVAPLGALATLLAPALAACLALTMLFEKRASRRVILVAALLVLAAALVVMGRRYLLYSLVLCFIALGFGGLQIRRLPRRTLALLLLAALFLYEGSRVFMAVRITAWSPHPHDGLIAMAKDAVPLLTGDNKVALQEILLQNSGSRPFILAYFAGLMRTAGSALPLFGGELVYSIQMVIPSFLLPSKLSSLPLTPEALVHPYYGISVFDGPGSILVSGFDDFGWLGILLYPLALVSLYELFFRFTCFVTSEASVRIFVWFVLTFELLYVEQGLTEQLVLVRNLLIVLAVGLIITGIGGVYRPRQLHAR